MKTLRQLIEGIPCSWNGKGELATQIAYVRSDSRHVKRGDLFVAVSGLHSNGREFISDALRRGAKAIVSERFEQRVSDLAIPQFSVSHPREVLSQLLARAYDFPAQRLSVIGVTGTNGKTTTAFLIQHLLNQVSRAGLIGTVCYDDGQTKRPAEHTTPIPEVLNETLARMVAGGLSYCVMEVSSHALDQNRVYGLEFSSAVFTNLTQDHLDYHSDFEAYYQAKRKLFFSDPSPKRSIINRDDSYGRRLASELKDQSRVITYGLEERCDYLAQRIQMGLSALSFELVRNGKRLLVQTPLILRHNVYNILAALSAVSEEGFSIEDLAPHLIHFPGVRGRMEPIDEGQDFHVFVDYAHTPDGLFNVLSSLAELQKSRVISVFGCGGDRDRAKRPVMGEIVNRFSDVVILTSDNPRGERPEDILEEVKRGIEGHDKKAQLFVLCDRETAIRQAVEMAEAGDLVLIFGKGHEEYQIFGREKIPFSDQEVVRHWLRVRCSRSTKSQKLAVEG